MEQVLTGCHLRDPEGTVVLSAELARAGRRRPGRASPAAAAHRLLPWGLVANRPSLGSLPGDRALPPAPLLAPGEGGPSAGVLLLVPDEPVEAVAVDHLAVVGVPGPQLQLIHNPPPLRKPLEPLP